MNTVTVLIWNWIFTGLTLSEWFLVYLDSFVFCQDGFEFLGMILSLSGYVVLNLLFDLILAKIKIYPVNPCQKKVIHSCDTFDTGR